MSWQEALKISTTHMVFSITAIAFIDTYDGNYTLIIDGKIVADEVDENAVNNALDAHTISHTGWK